MLQRVGLICALHLALLDQFLFKRRGESVRAVVLLMFAALAFVRPAYAEPTFNADCTVTEQPAPARLKCEIRSTDPKDITSYSARIGDKDLQELKFESFTKANRKSAWLFLIDRSNPARAATVARDLGFAKAVMRTATGNEAMGLATFAGDMKIAILPGEPLGDLDTRLAGIKADGPATEFFAAAIEASKVLGRIEADRRVLVVMSDGKAEDTAYTREDVLKAARDAKVIIYGIGGAVRLSDTPPLQEIRKLAEETGGPYTSVVGTGPVPADFASRFKSFALNGGELLASLAGVSGEAALTLIANRADGSSIRTTETIFVRPAPAGPRPFIASIYGYIDPPLKGASVWAATNPALAWGGLVLPFAIVAAGLMAFATRNRADIVVGPTEPFDPPGPENGKTLPPPPPMIGWFEVTDGSGQRFDIRSTNLSIGRHSDSDIRLTNDSVHRQHANFYVTPGGDHVIQDLDTVNGVYVNGVRVAKTELNSGDVIKLGDVTMVYHRGADEAVVQ
jgi:hypothetical protein